MKKLAPATMLIVATASLMLGERWVSALAFSAWIYLLAWYDTQR